VNTAQELDDRWTRRANASFQRQSLKLQAVEHLGGKCELCGYSKCLSVLQFHHMEPDKKDFNISSKMTWEAIVQELAKCKLVCANCHAEIHAGLHPHFLVLEDDLGAF
jgi:hypothetical protein